MAYNLYVLVHSVACELVQDKTASKSTGILGRQCCWSGYEIIQHDQNITEKADAQTAPHNTFRHIYTTIYLIEVFNSKHGFLISAAI